MALLKEDVQKVETVSRRAEDDSTPDLKLAVTNLNRATTLLFRILYVLSEQWHPDAKLPVLTMDDMDKSIQAAGAAIQNLLDATDSPTAIEAAKKGIIHKLGSGTKTVCDHVRPFLKTFLAVAVQGSAVRTIMLTYSH